MGKYVNCLLIIFMTGCFFFLAAPPVESESCSKPRVAVIFDEIINETEFFNHVNNLYPSQPDSSWRYQIEEKVLEELRMGSPDTEFIAAHGAAPDDCDYQFKFRMTLISAGEDIMWAGALLGEYTAFLMRSTLYSKDVCGDHSSVLKVRSTDDDEDLNSTIERNVSSWGDIGGFIEDREESDLVPPRGPEMSVSQSRKWVSPLKRERKLDLKIDVTNCKGQRVFEKNHGLKIFLPQKKARGENNPTKGFNQNFINLGESLILIIVRPNGASATYELKKGILPAREEFTIKTCGRDKRIEKKETVEIRGLEIRVNPLKRIIKAGEQTRINIFFNRTGLKNEKDPVKSKKIKIKVKGLVDGKISPSGALTTDNEGKAQLNYKAGKNDKQIVIEASYKPEDYPDTVVGKNSIRVSKEIYDLIAHVSADVSWGRKEEKTLTTGNASYSIDGAMKMKTDQSSLRVNPIQMTFEPLLMDLQYSIQEKQIDLETKNGCPELIYEISRSDTVSLPQIKDGPHYLHIQNFGNAAKRFPNVKISAQMSGFMMNWFDFLMEGDMAVLKGQKREGSYCGEKQCPCKEYKEYVVKRGVGWTGIRAYVDGNGSMTGNLSWEEDGIPDSVGFKVNLMTQKKKKGPEEKGKTKYSIQWNFQRIKLKQ